MKEDAEMWGNLLISGKGCLGLSELTLFQPKAQKGKQKDQRHKDLQSQLVGTRLVAEEIQASDEVFLMAPPSPNIL